MARSTRHRPRGFTLVELLVVVGILAVLIGVLLPTLARARRAASEARNLSNLRQLLIGYAFYVNENRGAVPFGHTPATVNGAAVTVDDPVSRQTFGYPISDRYPWRLVKDVSNVWAIVHGHDDVPPVPQPSDSAADAFNKAYTLSLQPTYGINGVYVGGDAGFGGFVGDRPNVGKHVVFRAGEVRHSSALIVFADSRVFNVPGLVASGYHLLTPPRANGLRWTVVDGVAKPAIPYVIMGLPTGWYTRRVITGFFDGHCEALLPDQLNDMRRWANRATTADYDYVP